MGPGLAWASPGCDAVNGGALDGQANFANAGNPSASLGADPEAINTTPFEMDRATTLTFVNGDTITANLSSIPAGMYAYFRYNDGSGVHYAPSFQNSVPGSYTATLTAGVTKVYIFEGRTSTGATGSVYATASCAPGNPTYASETGLYSGIAGGAPIQLTGVHFDNAVVSVNGVNAAITTNTATQLNFTTPANPVGSYDAIVSGTAGTMDADKLPSVVYVPSPTISAAFQSSSLTLNGVTRLTFTVAKQSSVIEQTLAFTTSLPSGLVVADTPNASSTNCTGVAFSPAAGASSVAVTSGRFPANTAGTSCTFSVDVKATSGGLKTVTPGDSLKPQDVVGGSTILGGVAGAPISLTVATIAITSITPNAGSTVSPAAVTIVGTNFSATGNAVTFGGVAGTIGQQSTTSITVTPPSHAAGAVDVVVTNNASQSATSAGGYTYVAAPIAGTASATVAFNASNTPVTLNLSGGAAVSVAVATGAGHGTATASGTAITYTPANGYSGADSFTYTATNAGGTSSPAAVNVTVNPQAPVAGPVTATVAYNATSAAITLNLSGGAAASVAVGSPAGHGVATASGTSITYTPASNYTGPDSFTYTATNAGGTSSPGTVSLTVALAPPIAGPVNLVVAFNSPSNAVDLNLSGGAATSVAVATGASHGTATASGLSITYTPAHGYEGADSFTYTASNGSGPSAPATVSITINPGAPIAGATTLTVGYNSSNNAVVLNLSGGAPSSVAVMSSPSHGTTTVVGTTIAYTPDHDYSGPDSFTYMATNAGGPSAIATVDITVTAEAPTLQQWAMILTGLSLAAAGVWGLGRGRRA